MDPNLKTMPEAEAVASIVRDHIKPIALKIEGQSGQTKTEVLMLPRGMEAYPVKRFLDEYRDKPERRKGTATLDTLESLIAHLNRFKDADSAIFADEGKTSLIGVLDYHRAGSAADPRFGQHRAVYAFPVSDEWEKWKAKNGEPMNQGEFAEFLEDRILDVVATPDTASLDPSHPLRQMAEALSGTFAGPSKLMELSRGLAVRVGEQVKSAVNLSTGEASIQYVSQHQDEAGQPVKVPSLFAIAIPVFKRGAVYQIPVRLRYRVRAGAITWSYELYRHDQALRDAFAEAAAKAGTDTELPVFFGNPEA